MPDRRFRDMSLTEDEAGRSAYERWFERCCGLDAQGTTVAVARYNKLETRAKRLLPLWREWGLQELATKEFAAGLDAHNESVTEFDQ